MKISQTDFIKSKTSTTHLQGQSNSIDTSRANRHAIACAFIALVLFAIASQITGRIPVAQGAEIARTEKLIVGKVPLHTLRADIDYSRTGARTTYGVIGVKVWINRGEILPQSSANVLSPSEKVQTRHK